MMIFLKEFSGLRAMMAMLFMGIAFSACGPKSTTIVSNLTGYDVNHPQKIIKFPPVLDEISGITYYAKDTSLFAIQDEEGFIYKIYPNRPDSMLRFKFAGLGDFEDVMLVDSTFYILRSDGDIYVTTIGEEVRTKEFNFPEKGNEFEGIAFDDSLRQLRLLCKSCKIDGKKHVSTYLFNPQTGAYTNDSMRIDAVEIAGQLGEKKVKFKPSAFAIHPITHKLYLLSSVNKVIIVANKDGSVVGSCELDPKIYKQPEGLAFAPDGTMYISNEWAKIGAANLFIIPYHTTNK